jgi:hypothetical protein
VRRALLTFVLSALFVAPAADAAQLVVSVTPTSVATKLGHTVVLRSAITNRGSQATGPLIAHLNVLSFRAGTYVDPEDWSSHRTRYLAPIPAGGARAITWRINTVNAGSIGVYVAVLRGGSTPPVAGPTVRIRIADRRTLDAGGILPLALGVPGALALLALVVRLRRRR